jgi:hypothetical protein
MALWFYEIRKMPQVLESECFPKCSQLSARLTFLQTGSKAKEGERLFAVSALFIGSTDLPANVRGHVLSGLFQKLTDVFILADLIHGGPGLNNDPVFRVNQSGKLPNGGDQKGTAEE